MPSSSKKQHNFMAAVANNPAFAKKVGVSKSVGEDFTSADKGKKFGTGGTIGQINKQQTRHGAIFGSKKAAPDVNLNKYAGLKKGGNIMAAKKKNPFAKFEKSGKDVEVKGKGKEGSKEEEAFDKTQMAGMKKGGKVKKMAKGGGIESRGKTRGKFV